MSEDIDINEQLKKVMLELGITAEEYSLKVLIAIKSMHDSQVRLAGQLNECLGLMERMATQMIEYEKQMAALTSQVSELNTRTGGLMRFGGPMGDQLT